MHKDTCSNSSKASLNCHNVSKSNSKKKYGTKGICHKKKKSLVLPTRAAKQLCSKKSESEKKKKSKIGINILKPSFSTSSIKNKPYHRACQSKNDLKFKFSTYDRFHCDFTLKQIGNSTTNEPKLKEALVRSK